MIRLVLPLPPSANRMWRKGKSRVYRSDEYTKFSEEVGWACTEKRIKKLAGNVHAEVVLYFARKNGDADNRIKPLLDSLIGYAYADDGQVVKLCYERRIDRRNPRAEIQLQAVAQ